MKKFSKILVLLLTLVFIVTAFTVTALATDGETEENMDHGVDYKFSNKYENANVGALFDNGHGLVRKGYMTTAIGEDGVNKYLVSTPGPDKGGNNSWMGDVYFGRPTKTTLTGETTYKYNLKDYPYMVLDFDICSPSGTFGSGNLFDFNYRFTFDGMKTDGNLNSSGNFYLNYSFSDFRAYIDATPYNWQHVSLVSHFVPVLDEDYGTIVSAVFYTDIYVNGEFKKTLTKTASADFTKKNPELVGAYMVRVGNGVTSGTALVDLSGFVATDKTTWPGYDAETETFTDPAEWFVEKAAMDNVSNHYYQSGWTSEKIAANLYTADYEFPFGMANAKVGETMYDNMDDAIAAAAASGETIYLLRDFDEPIAIEDIVKIDKNKYVDGVATGEYYNVSFTSNTLLVSDTTTDGVITFVDADAFKTNVYWDYCDTCACEDQTNHDAECSCACDYTVLGHKLYAESEGIIGMEMTYPGEIQQVTMMGTTVFTFIGWSRTPGGEAEKNLIVTQADLDEGMIFLYPVYKSEVCALMVTDPNNNVTYHLESEFASLFSSVESGSTITLIDDIDTDAYIEINKTITVDMNGFDIRRARIHGTTYRYNTGTESDEALFTISSAENFFKVTGTASLTFKSDVPGSEIHCVNMKRNSWVDENGVEKKFEASNPTNSVFFYAAGETFQLNLTNISIYATSVVRQYHDGGVNCSVNITGCKIYRTNYSTGTEYGIFHVTSKNSHVMNVTDSFIFANGNSYFMRVSNGASTEGTGWKVNFYNCDIYGKTGLHVKLGHHTQMQFYNTRYYYVHPDGTYAGQFHAGSMFTVSAAVATSGYTKIEAALPEGCTISPISEKVTYTVPSSKTTPLDENGMPTFVYTMQEDTVGLYYTVGKPISIKWMHNGELYATTDAVLGTVAVGPEIVYTIEDDLYRNGKYLWVDENGNTDLTIDDANKEYVFYSTETVNGERGYVASIKGAQMNFIYYSQFHMMLYLPVVEGMKYPTVKGASSQYGEVFIDGVEYWSYVWYLSTTLAFDAQVCNIYYTVDGQDFLISLPNLSALYYTEAVLSSEGYAPEHESVANMVRYIREAFEIKDITKYDADIERLIGTANADGSTTGGYYSLPAYVTEYPDTEYDDWSALSKYVSAIGYGMSGSSVKIYFRLTEQAKTDDIRMRVTCNGNDPTVYTDPDANGAPKNWTEWNTHNLKVYDAIHLLKITINKPNAETGVREVVAEATYSIGSYIEANPDVEVAKALYAFGKSAEEYRAYVKANNITKG